MRKYFAGSVAGWLVASLLMVCANATAHAQSDARDGRATGGAVPEAFDGEDAEPKVVFRRAVTAYEEKRLDDAAALWRQLLKRYPRNVAALNNLAVALFELNRPDEAVELLRRALSANQSIMTAYGNLTAVYERKAADAYRNALNIRPQEDKPLPLSLITVLGEAPAKPRRDEAMRAAPPQRRADRRAVADEVMRADNIDRPFVDDPVQAAAQTDKRKPKEAKKPTRASAKDVDVSAQQELAIEEAVNRWANAWSDRDLPAYYDSYVSGHSPSSLTHEEWRAFRAERLTAPKSIEITLFDFVLTSATRNKAQVEFVQRYRSSLLSSDSLKRLYLVREDGDWKIAREMLIRRLK